MRKKIYEIYEEAHAKIEADNEHREMHQITATYTNPNIGEELTIKTMLVVAKGKPIEDTLALAHQITRKAMGGSHSAKLMTLTVELVERQEPQQREAEAPRDTDAKDDAGSNECTSADTHWVTFMKEVNHE